jgi:predicted phage gp36 major capsid-like protein
MADTHKIREEIEALDVEIRSLHETEEGELREFTPEEQTTVRRQGRRARREARAARAPRGDREGRESRATVEPKREARTCTSSATRWRWSRTAPRPPPARRRRDALPRGQGRRGPRTWSTSARCSSARSRPRVGRGVILRSTDDYASAWLKLIQGREFALTAEERTVLGVSTNANGKYLLPTHLDPTIILTSALSTNEVRKIARVVTLTDGAPAWNGVTSAGVTASWDGEVVEVSDDTPTFGNPSIPTVRAQALVQASISAVEDIADLGNDVMMMFADAKDRLEGAAHATGAGTTTPKGVFTAVHAVSASRVVSTTAATIGLVDLNAVYVGVPKRYRGAQRHVARQPDLHGRDQGPRHRDLARRTPVTCATHRRPDPRRPVVESDDAPTTQTTTALDDEVLLGDFSSSSSSTARRHERGVHPAPVQHGEQPARRSSGWYATWRNGSDVTNADAFRLLVDKTTA